jgi:hypothetical protein
VFGDLADVDRLSSTCPAYAARELSIDARGLKPDVGLSANLRRRTTMHAANEPTAYRPTAARPTIGAPSTAPTRLIAVGKLRQVALMRTDQVSNPILEVGHGRKIGQQRRACSRNAHDVRTQPPPTTPTDQRAPYRGRSAPLAIASARGTPLTLHGVPRLVFLP